MQLPDAEGLCRQLAEQIRPHITPETALVGIHTGGVWIAERLHRALGLSTSLGSLDPAYYRDDVTRNRLHHQLHPSEIPFEVTDRPIVLVDDVLYTGRTIRATMNELFDYGRPARIDLAVLVDRGGRELPIHARFCAHTVEIPHDKNLQLERDEQGLLTLRLIDA